MNINTFFSSIEPCCCGLDHITEGRGVKSWPHHKKSQPYGYCEGCRCEHCKEAVEAKYGTLNKQ